MDTETTIILRLEIGGRWQARDLSKTITAIDDLYCLQYWLRFINDEFSEFLHPKSGRRYPPPPFEFFQWPFRQRFKPTFVRAILVPDEQLVVHRLDYASPGKIDLKGLFQLLSPLRAFIVNILDWQNTVDKRTEGVISQRLDNDTKRLANARQYVSLAREMGYSEAEIRRMVLWTDKRQQQLQTMIQDGALVDVDMPPNEPRKG